MMKRTWILGLELALVLALLLGVAHVGRAQQTSAMTLFDFGTTVRATGMGGAFAGLANDEQALIYNPAGLALLDQAYADITVQSHLGQATIAAALGAIPLFGVGVQTYNVGGLVQRNDQDEEGGPFGYGQFVFIGSGALPLGSVIGLPQLRDLGLGLRFKLLSVNTLAAGSGLTFALDPSVLWELGQVRLGPVALEAIRMGVALDNLGPGITYGSGYKEALSMDVRLGASARVQRVVTVSLEFNTYNGLHLGGEYELPVSNAGTLALRTGFNTLNTFTFNLGLGFTYRDWVRIDYAFSSHSQFFGSHQLAVATFFNVGSLF